MEDCRKLFRMRTTELCIWITAVTVAGLCRGDKVSPSFETLDTLFSLEDRVEINTISGDPVPIYRKDLSPSYAAYWMFLINENEQLIISAGPKTGDYKLVLHGPLPSLPSILDEIAGRGGRSCSTYFLLAPDVTLMCEDLFGQVVATTKDSYINYQTGDNDTTLRYRFVQNNIYKLKELWSAQAKKVMKERIWDDIFIISEEEAKRGEGASPNNDGLFVIRPGHRVKIPVTGKSKIKILAHRPNVQSRLCDLLGVCLEKKPEFIDLKLKQRTLYGVFFIDLSVPLNAHGGDISFDVRTLSSDGLVVKRFRVVLNGRVKRGATYSSWTQRSVGDEHLFPDYKQYKMDNGRGCSVGCGPVAWAMILGYFDRRSHEKPGVYGYGSRDMYRCGSSGTTGSGSCRAPPRNTRRMEGYLAHLHQTLGTFCLFGQGATLQHHMDRIGNFFTRSRQTSGNPTVTVHTRGFWSFVGIHNDDIRNTMFSALDSGWPVVAGIQVSNVFSQHYPVATKYRWREKTYKKCVLWWCRTTKEKEYEMYVHMGWGGDGNGWKNPGVFLAGYIKY